MGLLDDMKSKAQGAMQSDDMQAKAKKLAEEKGISLEAAKEHLMNKKSEE